MATKMKLNVCSNIFPRISMMQLKVFIVPYELKETWHKANLKLSKNVLPLGRYWPENQELNNKSRSRSNYASFFTCALLELYLTVFKTQNEYIRSRSNNPNITEWNKMQMFVHARLCLLRKYKYCCTMTYYTPRTMNY